MLKQLKYILMGLLLISSVMIVNAGRLEFPNSDRLCTHGLLAPGVPLWICSIKDATTPTMESSFLDYTTMHNYYTPQLKEVMIIGGVTTTFTMIPVKNSKTKEIVIHEYFTLDIEPDYLYTKNK